MFRPLYQNWLPRVLKLLRLTRNEPVPLNVGILIIGSLLWDLEDNRPAWRDARLDIASAEAVTAPIRYGRLSGKKRGRTYTMVFSRFCQIGQGKVVRCSHTVSSAVDLIAEAERLWKAEEPDAAAGRLAANWGCVVLLCNPARKIPEGILTRWAERVANEPGYGNVSQTHEEGRLVSDDGVLRIDWPRLVESGAPVSLDLLLVTANDPRITVTTPAYPGVETIANAWNTAASKHAEYFWKNLDNGIRSFQDDEIRARLRPRGQEPR
jgi:hypothetical protein